MISNLVRNYARFSLKGTLNVAIMTKSKHFLKDTLSALIWWKNILSTLRILKWEKICAKKKSVRQRKMKKQKVTVTITVRNSTNHDFNLKKLKVAELNNIFFATTYQGEKCPNQKNLTFCQLTSAMVYVKGSWHWVLLKLQQQKTRTPSQKMMLSWVPARTKKVKMNYYWNLGMQATQTKMIQRTAKVKRKMSCPKGPG